MGCIHKQEVDTAGSWHAADFVGDQSWLVHFTDAEIAALDHAVAAVMVRGLRFPDFGKDDFPLAGWAERLRSFADELENGRGFLLARGLPVDRYSDEEIEIAYYGIGLHLGQPVRQNPRGDLLGVVMNVGYPNDRNTRVYQTNKYLPYHTDPSDVVGLLCVRKAKQGGERSLVSIAALYNRLLRDHPEYLGLLHRPFYYAHLGGDLPTLSPLLSFYDGKLACRYLRQYIESGHEVMGAPLSQVEIEALDIIDSITQDPAMRIDMMLEPGDIQLANNYMVMHSRTSFEDDEDPARYRKKLRLWLKMDNARRLAPDFPGRNGLADGTRCLMRLFSQFD